LSQIGGSATSTGPSDEDLERVMREVPRGAFALAALTVGLLLAGWLLVYFFVFLPRGMVS